MNKEKRILILKKFEIFYMNATTELKYNTSFELLIAIILSAQSSDTQVNNVTKQLFSKVSRPSDILKLGLLKLKKILRTIGLFNKKAEYIMNTCRLLANVFNESIPLNINQLLRLPGVGRKTANLFLNIVLKKKYIAVDTHVFRVSNRTGFATGASVGIVEKKLHRVVPSEFKLYIHAWFVIHGRYVCIAKKPKCLKCVINHVCEYFYKNFNYISKK
ncbi:endonuclease III [Buchnera aphidicola]|uniref:endonuclease III n=1 Tax=Buchnera aphidicola TaxID=9 RepID=UPI00094CA0E4|nr:endonuclease III [Buchnera aphidicola]